MNFNYKDRVGIRHGDHGEHSCKLTARILGFNTKQKLWEVLLDHNQEVWAYDEEYLTLLPNPATVFKDLLRE